MSSIVNNNIFNGIIVTFLSLTSFYLGFGSYIRNKKSDVNRIFARFAFATAIWILFAYLTDLPSLRRVSLILAKCVYAALASVSYSLLSLTFVFPRKRHLNRLIKYFLLVWGTGAVLLTFATDLVIKELTFSPWGSNFVDGDLSPLFYIFMLVGAFSPVQYFFIFKRFNKREKIQVKYFAIGLSLFMGANIFFQGIVKEAITHTDEYYRFGNYSAIFLIGFSAYAIIKHRFMDIRLIVARAVSYALLVGLLAVTYSLSLQYMAAVFFPTGFQGQQILVSAGLAVIGAFIFQPLRRFLENITDSVFYQGKYDSQLVQSHLAQIMASTRQLEELTHQLLQDLLEQVKLSRGAFILMKDGQIYDFKSEGFEKAPALSEKEINFLYEQRELLVFEELEEGRIKELMRKYDLTIASPLFVKGEDIGLLVLGEKLSGDIYTAQDLSLLESLSPQFAVALQNAIIHDTQEETIKEQTQDLADKNERLEVANVKLEELDKLKDEFISMASHELKAPTGAIRDRLWMIEQKPQELDEKIKHHLGVAYDEATRLINLVNDMLNVSRIEQGRIKFTMDKVDLSKVIEEMIDEYKATAQKKGLELKYIKLGKKIPQVYADCDKIKIILGNLISNAIKFTEKGYVHVEVYPKGESVQVNVTDSGKGVSQKDITKLFEKFSRIEKTQERVEKGTGLGLYITKKFAELMNGRIWVKSAISKGSTFSFTLPSKKK